MSAEFNWWLLIVGVVAGAALTWLVVADSTRREREVGERELPAEAAWIARSVGQPGVDAAAAEAILRAHRRYLGFPPPDVLVDPDQLEAMIQDGGASAADPDSIATVPASALDPVTSAPEPATSSDEQAPTSP
jgi:hypothetical protein